MCIDDYEFRHYSATRPKQCRRFVITNEDQIEKVFLVNISQFQQENGQVALCNILLYLAQKGLSVSDRSFYLPKYNVYIHPKSRCRVPFEALTDKSIIFTSVKKGTQPEGFQNVIDPQLIKNEVPIPDLLNKNQQPVGCCQYCIGKMKGQQIYDIQKLLSITVEEQSQQNQQYIPQPQKMQKVNPKKQKQRERGIGQVIMAVKKWRLLYDIKKIKLSHSAKFIGISKKSLDDYYLVLRIGQILGFNYGQNLDKRMGDLRTYINSFEDKVQGKLFKSLKCFDLVPDFDMQQVMEIETPDQNQQKKVQEQNPQMMVQQQDQFLN